QSSGGASNPRLRQVNPPASAVSAGEVVYSTVQAALQAAAAANDVSLVVVWPNAASQNNPYGAYFENVVVHSSVRLQGVGPGGQYPGGSSVAGSVLDGRGFGIGHPSGAGWVGIGGGAPAGAADGVPGGGGVAGAGQGDPVPAANAPTVDGFRIMGGNQSDFAG